MTTVVPEKGGFELVIEPTSTGVMVDQKLLRRHESRSHITALTANLEIVFQGLRSQSHGAGGGSEAVNREVRPQGGTQKTNVPILIRIVIQYPDGSPNCNLLELMTGLFPDLTIELMIPGDVEHRNWPIPETLNGLHSTMDVTGQDLKVGIWVRGEKMLGTPTRGQEFQMEVRGDLDFRVSGLIGGFQDLTGPNLPASISASRVDRSAPRLVCLV